MIKSGPDRVDKPNLMFDARETITGTRNADVFAPAWSIVDGLTALRFGARPGCLEVVFESC